MSQTQTPTSFWKGEPEVMAYTPGSQVYAGDVVVINGGVFIVYPNDIPMTADRSVVTAVGTLARRGGRWIGPKKASEALAVNDAIYWDSAGDPSGGTAGTGAFTRVASGHILSGIVTKAAVAADTTVEFAFGSAAGNVANTTS